MYTLQTKFQVYDFVIIFHINTFPVKMSVCSYFFGNLHRNWFCNHQIFLMQFTRKPVQNPNFRRRNTGRGSVLLSWIRIQSKHPNPDPQHCLPLGVRDLDVYADQTGVRRGLRADQGNSIDHNGSIVQLYTLFTKIPEVPADHFCLDELYLFWK